MKAFLRQITNRFTSTTSSNEDIHRMWDHLREQAVSPSDRAEIDAIFARSL